MFPTFISILDIQSWWEVPSIAHFCSLFRTAFNLLDFDIECFQLESSEYQFKAIYCIFMGICLQRAHLGALFLDLEEALLTDGTEESSWLQELIVRLLSGCLPNNEISTFNYQMFLRRLFRQKCQEHDRYNPFNTDCDFTLLPLRTKVDILHALCDFRLDAEDVLDQLKNLEADSLRVEPLGYDKNDSAYWYFYGTRLYREDFQKKNNKKKAVWQVICFTEDDWFQLTKKFKSSSVKNERALYHTLSKNFLPELPRLFKEKERQARRRLLENQPRRTSDRIRKLDRESVDREETGEQKRQSEEERLEPAKEEHQKKKEQDNRRKESYEKRFKPKEIIEEGNSECEGRHEMASKKKNRARQRKISTDSSDSNKEITPPKRKKTRASEKSEELPSIKPTVGRQTNNSLSALDGQIVIQQGAPLATSTKKKLKTSQVFQQTDEDLLVGMHKILDFVKNHEDAWPFLDPVEEEYAPNYYSIIRRPMDLTKMEDKLDQGYYKSYDKFKGDFQLIVNNCRLYNGAENEYTQMVDNLVKVFEKATERYLDQISSSDEEIAVENLNSGDETEDTKSSKSSRKKKHFESPSSTINRSRKPVLVAQGKKRERSASEKSDLSLQEEVLEPKFKKSKKQEKESRKEEKQFKKLEKESKESKKNDKGIKKLEKEFKKSEKELTKPKKSDKEPRKFEKETKIGEKESKKLEEKESKKQSKPSKSKKENKLESTKETKIKSKEKKPKKRGRKKKRSSPSRSRTPSKSFSSRSPSPSPPRSVLSTPPPSSPDDDRGSRFNFHRADERLTEKIYQDSNRNKKSYPWDFIEEPPPAFSPPGEGLDKKMEDLPNYSPLQFSFKPAKDKHNKLRETIEKLKAKSEISRMQTPVYDFEVDDHLKENKDKNKKIDDKQHKMQHKDKIFHMNKTKKNHHQEQEIDFGGNVASQSEALSKKSSKKKDKDHHVSRTAELQMTAVVQKPTKQSNYEALSLATEQTLKDINKWLDDTPKFADFSSASNSPSYLALDDFDLLGTPRPLESKKIEKPVVPVTTNVPSPIPGIKKDGAIGPTVKEGKKKTFRDPSKFFNKRREVQRTIDRLQPGKSKGNLISNVQNSTKTDEIFPLGPLSKIKDTKNSLIVKTDTNAPKLSLGSVLDSFGKHKFVVDDQKKEEEEAEKQKTMEDDTKREEDRKKQGEEVKKEERDEVKLKVTQAEVKDEKEIKEIKPTEEVSAGGPTPNLSAWFKAFGAPKAPLSQKKSDKTDSKEEEPPAGAKSERVPPSDPSPNLESPQPVARQRRISTGSSMSERSSFSQDLDSPRVGMEERGAYPAPYPSPLHKSPSSGASPVMASPRPDISPRSPYPFNGGQMRVGFYQDTVASSKSSPDKSCSPRENPPNSPFYQPTGAEHVYAPNTTQSGYSASYTGNSPYYTHPPNYSSTNPTPPYNMDGSSNAYYDTSKIVEQYQAKPSQNYTANSPASSQASPAPQPLLSPHSPIVHHPQSPSVHSPSIHSPTLQSPSMHSPSLHSPSVHSSQHSHSPQLPSPGQSLHSPGMSVVSPQVNSPGVQHSPMALNSPSMNVNSPMNPGSVENFHAQPDETSSGNSVTPNLPPDNKEPLVQQQLASHQSVFPVKKRAFLDTDLSSQFAAIHEEMTNRNLHIGHQMSSVRPSDQEVVQVQTQHHLLQQEQLQKQHQHMQKQQQLQEAQEQLIHKHQQHLQKQQLQESQEQLMHKHQQHLQDVQEQLLQKHQQQIQEAQEQIVQQAHAQLQQQKNQQLLQQQKNQQLLQQQKNQQMLQEQQKAQQQLLQEQQQKQQQQLLQEQKKQQLLEEQKQQQLLQEQKQQQLLQQKNLQLLQQHAMAAFGKASSASSDQSLRTPSPPTLSQQQPAASVQQQSQRSQQQTIAHSGVETSSSSVRSMAYPVSTSSQSNHPYNSNFGSREAYPLNVPTARALQSPHQQKLDMSKFTNMGYSGPEVNFSRALQQQYSRSELSYTRTTVQSAISQASQLLNSQALSSSQTSASSTTSLPGYQKSTTNQQQAHSATYQSSRLVDSVAERLAAHVQQEAAGYKQDSRSSYNSASLDLEQALGLTRNIVDRYSNEQRMMAGLQSAPNPYYTDKGLGTPHMFNKQIFSQSNMAAMGYGQQQQQPSMQQQTQAATQSLYGRQMAAELQSHDLKSVASTSQVAVQDRKQRKKKSASKGATSDGGSSLPTCVSSQATPTQGPAPQQHGFQSYAGLKASPGPSSSAALDPAAIALKTSSVPGSAFNFGSGALGMGTGLSESYPNLLDDFRGTSNYFMGGANAKPGQSGQGYPPFLNPASHQGRGAAYPLGGAFMDTSSQLYQHYLQTGVLNQGLLGAATGGYPPGYHAAALAMRQPYDSMSRPSWL